MLSMFVENDISRIKGQDYKGRRSAVGQTDIIMPSAVRPLRIFGEMQKLLPPDHPCYAVARLGRQSSKAPDSATLQEVE